MAEVDLPTLIICGDEDEPCLQPSLYLKRMLLNAGLAMFAKTGHTVNIEEPDAFPTASSWNFLVLAEAGGMDAGRAARSAGSADLTPERAGGLRSLRPSFFLTLRLGQRRQGRTVVVPHRRARTASRGRGSPNTARCVPVHVAAEMGQTAECDGSLQRSRQTASLCRPSVNRPPSPGPRRSDRADFAGEDILGEVLQRRDVFADIRRRRPPGGLRDGLIDSSHGLLPQTIRSLSNRPEPRRRASPWPDRRWR